MARRTHFSNTLQRSISLLTGEERKAPINPLSRHRGVVQIGNQGFISVERLEAVHPITDWNEAKQAARPHECAAALMGMMCGHA